MRSVRGIAWVLIVLAATTASRAQSAGRPLQPAELLDGLTFDQRLGAAVPLDAAFRDETGATVTLGDYAGDRPIVLALVYYECPMACTQIIDGVIDTIDGIGFAPGEEYEIVFVSIDAAEEPPLAAAKKQTYMAEVKRRNAAVGVHFLTGPRGAIDAVADAIGYSYRYDPATKQYAHPSGITVVTPRGELSHYFYGIRYSPRDLRLALIEASANKIGSPVDQLLLFCFSYDPMSGTYSMAIVNALRLGGIATMAGLVGFIGMALIRERRRRRRSTTPPMTR